MWLAYMMFGIGFLIGGVVGGFLTVVVMAKLAHVNE